MFLEAQLFMRLNKQISLYSLKSAEKDVTLVKKVTVVTYIGLYFLGFSWSKVQRKGMDSLIFFVLV